MLIPAGVVLENMKVNARLPLHSLVRGVLRSTALWNQQNKLSGTVMEQSSVETNQGMYMAPLMFVGNIHMLAVTL